MSGVAGSLLVYVLLYLIVLILLTYYAKSKGREGGLQDFYNASKTPIGVIVLIFTFSATLFSAFFMVGLPGFIYSHGFGTWPYVIFGDVLGMVCLFYVGKRFLLRKKEIGGSDIISPLQVIFQENISRVVFIIWTTIFILPYLSVQITGFGKLIESSTSGQINAAVGAGATLFVIYLYSLISGIRGIAFSDTLQGGLLLICVTITGVYLSFWIFDNPIQMYDTVSNNAPMIIDSPGPKGFFTNEVLFTGLLIFTAIPITQPQFLTRYLLIKSENGEKYLAAISIGMGALIVFGSFMVLPIGLYGVIEYPGLRSGDELLGLVLNEHFPVSFSGLFTIGVLAAAMSTADSILFSMGQIFASDIYSVYIEKKSDPINGLIAGRSFIFAVAVIALMLGLSNSQLIVQLSSWTFAGMLLLVPSVIAGLWQIKCLKYTPAISIVIGAIVFLYLSINKISFFVISPAVASFLVSGIVCFLSYLFSHNNSRG